ncbi:hypothetical protein HNO89_003191 [Sporosarcina luteola]|nr:hypothetical protein [Sporosarcina luteola]
MKQTSALEAKQYFRKRYGKSYREACHEQLDENHICYFYEVDYQPVQISVFDDGSVLVHVVYLDIKDIQQTGHIVA